MFILLLATQLISQPQVYFHPRASGMVIRYPSKSDSVAVYYSLDGSAWKGNWMVKKAEFLESYLPVKGQPMILTLLFKTSSGIDDNNGDLYIYELSWRPRSILQLDFPTLERMLLTAQGKLLDPKYQDEGNNIIDYLDQVTSRMPRYRHQFNLRVDDLRARLR